MFSKVPICSDSGKSGPKLTRHASLYDPAEARLGRASQNLEKQEMSSEWCVVPMTQAGAGACWKVLPSVFCQVVFFLIKAVLELTAG